MTQEIKNAICEYYQAWHTADRNRMDLFHKQTLIDARLELERLVPDKSRWW